MDRYDIEDIVLGLADIVQQNRYLRKENARLRKVEQEYHQYILDKRNESEEASLNMLKACIVPNKNIELADLIKYL